MPVLERNSSAPRCARLPAPTEAKVTRSFFASAISSCTFFTGSDGGASSTSDTVVRVVTPVKSRSVS